MDPTLAELSKELVKRLLDFGEEGFLQSKVDVDRTTEASVLMSELMRATRDAVSAGTPMAQVAGNMDHEVLLAISRGLETMVASRPLAPNDRDTLLKREVAAAITGLAQVEHLLWTVALSEIGYEDSEARGQAEVRWRQASFHGLDILATLELQNTGDLTSGTADNQSTPQPRTAPQLEEARLVTTTFLTDLAALGPAVEQAAAAAAQLRPEKR